MHKLFFARSFASLIIGLLISLTAAHAESPSVEIEKIDFRKKGGLTTIVTLRGGKNANPEAPNPNYVDNIEITLTLGFENDRQSGAFFFYESTATLITIESGKKVEVPFMLPEIIVERDNLPSKPKFYLVELAVDGEELPVGRANSEGTLATMEIVESFKSKASEQTGDTEGILVPHYLANSFGKDGPAYFRVESE